jgi:hypothetical protein
MITATGFDYHSFYSLLQVFSPFFFNASPYSLDEERRLNRTGRPRKIDVVTCLGLVLVWTRSQGGLIFFAANFWLDVQLLGSLVAVQYSGITECPSQASFSSRFESNGG